MPKQLPLAGFATELPPTDRLFLAIFPDASTADRMALLAQHLRAKHGMFGRPLASERFHITLVHLGDYAGLPQGVVRTASEAAATVAMPPFDVAFEHTESFSGRSGGLPFVLCGNDGVNKLKAFRQTLGVALAKAGLGDCVTSPFNPHVTLLYDAQFLPEEAVDPVGWTVNEFVLVHSLLGQTRHIPLGRWPLRG